MDQKNKRTKELAPCGVYCAACPSYSKTCLGCSSDKKQIRKSKWNCKIRICCYALKELDYCFDCGQFPCKIIHKKLIDSHAGDSRFKYRHELPENYIRYNDMKLDKYLQYQKEKWKCPDCGGTVKFYIYSCDKCGKQMFPGTASN